MEPGRKEWWKETILENLKYFFKCCLYGGATCYVIWALSEKPMWRGGSYEVSDWWYEDDFIMFVILCGIVGFMLRDIWRGVKR